MTAQVIANAQQRNSHEDHPALPARSAATSSGSSRADVSLPVLTDQVEAGEGTPPTTPGNLTPRPPRPAAILHRRFFTAAIVTILTVGAGWGVLLLWQLAASKSFTGLSIHQINAHGHAQIFGWVALFIMGFAYEIFPRIWRAGAVNAAAAQFVFILMLGGLLLSIAGIASPQLPASYSMAFIGGWLQVAACVLFAAQIVRAFLRRNARSRLEPSMGFILVALMWLVVMSVFSVLHTLAILSAESPEALLRRITTWQAALRDTQVHGLALFMILGVSTRLLPGMFGLPRVEHRRGWLALILVSLAVVLECTLLITSQATGNMAIAAGLLVPWLLLPIGVGLVVWPWKLWRQVHFTDRSAKFVRIAYGWLFVSFAMLLVLPVYQWLLGSPFSHAYYGAARHAITVGFVSLMIVGISSKMAPGLRGMNIRSLPQLWIPFILINTGCAMRVSLQILSDWTPIAYTFIAFSGVLELIGLAVWAMHLIYVMWFAPIKNQPALRQPAQASE